MQKFNQIFTLLRNYILIEIKPNTTKGNSHTYVGIYVYPEKDCVIDDGKALFQKFSCVSAFASNNPVPMKIGPMKEIYDS